jgi:hypothetical protein
MILDEQKMIFVHIPKNAGTSIESVFLTPEYKEKYPINLIQRHATIHEIKKVFPDKYNSYIKFAVIRNPYDRMASWYHYVKQVADEHNHNNMLNPNKMVEFNYSFLEFLQDSANITQHITKSIGKIIAEQLKYNIEYNKQKEKMVRVHYKELFKPQKTFLDKTVRLIKYEFLEEIFFKLFKVNLPIKNKTARNHYKNYYNDKCEKLVYKRYKEDFKEYKFKRI